MITIDFNKAKEVTRNRLRAERAPLLSALDVQFQRNLESGADNTSVVAEKQRLRDITKLVDECTNVDELKALNMNSVPKPVEQPVGGQ